MRTTTLALSSRQRVAIFAAAVATAILYALHAAWGAAVPRAGRVLQPALIAGPQFAAAEWQQEDSGAAPQGGDMRLRREPPPYPRPLPRPLPPPPAWGARVTPDALSLDVTIEDGVATTVLREEIRNFGDRPLEAQFLLPIPSGAIVHDASLRIGNEVIEAEVLEAGHARGAYEEIVRRNIDPALIEHLDDGLLRTRVFPVPPHGSRELQLTLTLGLPEDFGVWQYRFPLRVLWPDAPDGAGRVPRRLTIDGRVVSARPLAEPYSPTHDLDVTLERDGHHARFSLEDGDRFAVARDLQLFVPTRSRELTIHAASTKLPGADGFALLRIAPGTALDEQEHTPRRIVFALDTSGSMEGRKIAQARQALAVFLESLTFGDQFAVITYSSGVTAWSDELLPADRENIRDALQRVDSIRPRGGTNIGEALQAALDLAGSRREGAAYVLFLTDGQPTVGTTDISVLLSQAKGSWRNRSRVRVFSFGVGTDVNTRLLDGLASSTGGLARYVLPEEDLDVAVGNLCAQIAEPLWTDLELRLSRAGLYDLVPDQLPDLFRGQAITVLARYRHPGSFAGTLTGQRGGVRQSADFRVTLASRGTVHDYLPQLWAGRRVASLQAALRAGGDRDELVAEIVELGTRYGIVTEYTSLLMREPDANVAAAVRGGRGVVPEPLRRDAERLSSAITGEEAVRRAAREGQLMQSKSLAEQDAALSAPMPMPRSESGTYAMSNASRDRGGAGPDGNAPSAPATPGPETARRAGGRLFRLDPSGTWVDRMAEGATPRLTIEAFSAAYFELLRLRPDLAGPLSVGTHVKLAVGRDVLEVGPTGVSTLPERARSWLAAGLVPDEDSPSSN